MGKQHYQEAPSLGEKKAFAKYLAEDEELIIATGYGKAYLRSRYVVNLIWPGIIPMALGLAVAYIFKFNLGYGLLIGIALASVTAFIQTFHTYHSHRYLLTTRRVIIKKGVFAVQLTSALFDKVTHIEVEQPFMDKVLMHHGKIIINTAGTNKGEITIDYIEYPIEFKNLLERLINREREQFGIRPGPVMTVEGEIV